MTKKENKVDLKMLCPYCHGNNVIINGEQCVKDGEHITYNAKCANCGTELKLVYKCLGFKTDRQFQQEVGNYIVKVVIEGISPDEYADNYKGNAETKEIMSLYERKTYPLRSVFEMAFITEENALAEYQRHASFHESENGDALNIALVRDEREHDAILKAEDIKCKDGHHIRITLSYKG